MSVLLLAHGDLPAPPPFESPLLPALHAMMAADFHAQPLQLGLYRTLLPRPSGCLELLWRFEPAKAGNLKLSIRPNFCDGHSGNFRVDSQRGFVDLLRAISSCNRDKSRTMSVVVSEYSFVEIVTMYPAEYLKDVRFLRRLVKTTFSQLPAAIDRLMIALQPFREAHNRPSTETGMSPTAKNFLDRSYKLLLLAKYNQLHSTEHGRG
jgi:hypothetical protein